MRNSYILSLTKKKALAKFQKDLFNLLDVFGYKTGLKQNKHYEKFGYNCLEDATNTQNRLGDEPGHMALLNIDNVSRQC